MAHPLQLGQMGMLIAKEGGKDGEEGNREDEGGRTTGRFECWDGHGELKGEGGGGGGENDGWECAEDYLRASGMRIIDGLFVIFHLRCHIGGTKEDD